MSDENHLAHTATDEAVRTGVGIGLGALVAAGVAMRKRIAAWWRRPTLADALTKLSGVVEKLDGTMKSVITGLRDISDGLAVAEANVGLMLDASTAAVWFTNAQGECVRVNRALCDLFELTPEQALGEHGRGWLRAVVPEHRERVWREFKSAIANGIPYACHYSLQTSKGLVNVVATGEVIRSRDDRILTVRGTVEPLPSIAA